MRLLSLACAVALGLTSIAAFAATPASSVPGREAIVSKTLANGLKIVVWPDHDIPSANYYTFYKVGSRNEYPGITGLAQVRGLRGTTGKRDDLEQRLYADLGYGANWSLLSDIRIVFNAAAGSGGVVAAAGRGGSAAGGSKDAGVDDAAGSGGKSSGCSCSSVGGAGQGQAGWLALGLLLAGLAIRKRRALS